MIDVTQTFDVQDHMASGRNGFQLRRQLGQRQEGRRSMQGELMRIAMRIFIEAQAQATHMRQQFKQRQADADKNTRQQVYRNDHDQGRSPYNGRKRAIAVQQMLCVIEADQPYARHHQYACQSGHRNFAQQPGKKGDEG